MKTTMDSNYINNATQWWNWLLKLSNNGKIMLKLKEYLNDTTVASSKNIKNNISKVLKRKPFFCDSSDGGIIEPIKNKKLKDNVEIYFKFISEIMAIEIETINTTYKTYKGYTKRLSLTKEFRNELTEFNSINNKKIFSYAFVRSSKRDYNFSATFYQKND
jgi:2C-methyl-D-erythritol 2,4-cyclodiphosphate synthase